MNKIGKQTVIPKDKTQESKDMTKEEKKNQ
jgi:hypothetical protein